MICMSLRSFVISLLESLLMSFPSKYTSPEVGSMRRKIERPVVDLPHPDSPTIPRVFPRSRVKFTSSTAWSSPFGVLKYFFRCFTSRIVSAITAHSFQWKIPALRSGRSAHNAYRSPTSFPVCLFCTLLCSTYISGRTGSLSEGLSDPASGPESAEVSPCGPQCSEENRKDLLCMGAWYG